MSEGKRERVLVREVGLRDGLQLAKSFLPTDRKMEWIKAEAAAGVAEIEVTSFVPPHVIAQFADAAEVAKAALAVGGIVASALVVNLRGAIRAFDAGLRKVNYVVSASEAHSLANVRRSQQDAIEIFAAIVEARSARGLADRVSLGCGIATAFGCTIQGAVAETVVAELAARVSRIGADEIMVADTVGYADPNAVRRVFSAVADTIGVEALVAHFHDTRGLGLANVTAALEVGVRRFDASLGGLGGCPFAPGATGNINMEDCVYLLQSMGFDTGIDLGKLLDLRRKVEAWLPTESLTGSINHAGLPRTFARRV
jgi:hydroxymethylglutaryl-CoA lyase